MKVLQLLLLAGMFILPVQAQTDEENAETTEEVAAGGQRPAMPNLFYRQEQRRVLEAVRQGVVEEEDFNIEEFVPVVIIEESLQTEEEEEVLTQRSQELHFNSYIVNRQNGKSVLWINGAQLLSERDSDVLERQGLSVLDENTQSTQIEGGVLVGDDVYSNSQFNVRVGQIIAIDGSIEETLPVIVKKQ